MEGIMVLIGAGIGILAGLFIASLMKKIFKNGGKPNGRL